MIIHSENNDNIWKSMNRDGAIPNQSTSRSQAVERKTIVWHYHGVPRKGTIMSGINSIWVHVSIVSSSTHLYALSDAIAIGHHPLSSRSIRGTCIPSASCSPHPVSPDRLRVGHTCVEPHTKRTRRSWARARRLRSSAKP